MKGRLRIALFAAAFTAVAFFVAHIGAHAFSEGYAIGFDPQKTTCLPWRVFLLEKGVSGELRRGDIVRIHAKGLEPHFEDGAPLTKFVAGLPGDTVVVRDDKVYINGLYWGRLWLLHYLKKKPGSFDRSFTVPEGHVLLMGVAPNAYDGRYWDAVPVSWITGRATPLL